MLSLVRLWDPSDVGIGFDWVGVVPPRVSFRLVRLVYHADPEEMGLLGGWTPENPRDDDWVER